ncbi:pyruvate dehydrogenase E1 component alpha subunit [Tistlia consotensis]|uniref:Pyruvate dehydrogenase E1 component subunit alpha n=1 Tax=Tistlia consotensis USBA 355 TaxID=560819 RepID=A0A1Y6CCN5_9PROT|nr:pyruvate dehydrogenase (acetyl-transferring) E1 component subunit alpha [Tistlia consotensis]SMF48458.1 pyruvate dehydrogenase E1 component alpha subunit [Tistlia consotensis USBA 355]SNR81207.1 pyruvate dehydrogenase E1 component alpha subunit [Tistlia consotensis]
MARQPGHSIVARFSIEAVRCIDAAGRAVGPLPGFAADKRELAALYRGMVLTRTFDQKAVALQRTGQLGTYASSLGQEAVAVGLASAMRPEDVLLPSFREHGAQLWRGVAAEELFRYWGGDERGSDFAAARADWPVSIPVASHVPHAVGVAWALQLGGAPRVAVCVLGDAATSKGDFYEALNLAGAWALPVVFLVCNNRWGISVPVERQTAAGTLAQKALAAGIEGIQVDGNDVVAVREVVAGALDKARRGGGATLVEALTYRLGDHTTADDASRYRDSAEVSARWHEEPVARLRAFLTAQGLWSKDEEEALLGECHAAIEAAAEAYRATPPAPPTAIFDSLFATLPAALEAQRREVARRGGD